MAVSWWDYLQKQSVGQIWSIVCWTLATKVAKIHVYVLDFLCLDLDWVNFVDSVTLRSKSIFVLFLPFFFSSICLKDFASLNYWHLYQKAFYHIHLFLDSLFIFIDLYIYTHDTIPWFWLLCLYSRATEFKSNFFFSRLFCLF